MSENDDLIEGAPVPSMGSLFDDPESTPPVVSARPAATEGGRLYRSAHAVGPAAALAIQALPRPKPVDESLPLSPETMAAEQPSAPEPDEQPPAAENPVVETPVQDSPAPVEGDQIPAEPATTADAGEAPILPVVAAAVVAPVADVQQAIPEAPPVAAPAAQAPPVPVVAQAWPVEPVEPVVPEAAAPVAVQPAAPPPAMLALPVADPIESRGLPWLTWTQATAVMVGVTVLAAIIDVLLRNGIGAVTGIGLLASTVVCGLRLRREDIWAAVVVPPLAFLAALVTVGQFAIGSTGGFVSRQALNIVTGLSLNAPWILGATVVGLAIVLFRRHREGPVGPGLEEPEAPAAGPAESPESVPPVTAG